MDISVLLAPFSSLYGAVAFILPFLVVMTVIVFFHELGHFAVARYFGVRVQTFSIGFGREIAGWTDKHGTRWKIGWLPLGGYVKFEGDENAASMPSQEASRNPGSFHAKPLWQRALIVAAGPFANFILAILIFAAMYSMAGVPVMEPVASQVMENSPAEKAGIRPGDRFVSINGETIDTFLDISRIVAMRPGEEVQVVVERGGKRHLLQVTLGEREVPDGLGGKLRIGFLGVAHDPAGGIRFERKGPLESLAMGAQSTWRIVTGTMLYLKQMVVGRQSTEQLAGPIRIAQMSKKAAQTSWLSLVQLAAVLSVSIGLINLFPIPMLDGGHLLYYGIEAVRGKPLSENAQEFGFRVGLALVLALMLVATFNDIMHLFSRN